MNLMWPWQIVDTHDIVDMFCPKELIIWSRIIEWWLWSLMPLPTLEIGVPGENHRSSRSHWQTIFHNVVSRTPRLNRIRTHNVRGERTDCICSCKSNHHAITTGTAPSIRHPPNQCSWRKNCRSPMWRRPRGTTSAKEFKKPRSWENCRAVTEGLLLKIRIFWQSDWNFSSGGKIRPKSVL